MKKLSLNTLRKMFLDYFKENDHHTVVSYPLVPQNDKSLLYIVAGMVPLKDYFAGVSTPPSVRMATSQKCIRTNDIDNVGYTARHCSMFEMLGNFSFGDYFKERAIKLAWEFFVNKLEIPEEKLSVSVYEEDDESYDIWTKIMKVPSSKVVRLGKEDNFWEIGSGTGPCGPCTEIFYDRGEHRGCGKSDCKTGCDCDRFVEVWNLVFTQYDKQPDGTLKPLEKKNIDTGMGLERLACVMQDVESVFDVDVMQNLISSIEKISGKTYGENSDDDVSIRIIADHIRAVTFIISEGVVPDNEGRGYVLRMLLRRAVRRGKLLGINEKFMNMIADDVIDMYKCAYPELDERKEYIKNIINIEEERFAKTLDNGLKILDGYIDELKKENSNILPGEKAFKLYDTYGFPLDMTRDVLRAYDLKVNIDEFQDKMERQRELARSARSADTTAWDGKVFDDLKGIKTEFVGYEYLEYSSKALCIISKNSTVDKLSVEDGEALVVFDISPMYCNKGGQVSDTGRIVMDGVNATISDVIRLNQDVVAHKLILEKGEIITGQNYQIMVDSKERFDIMRNHTATHLLHQALRNYYGSSVEQSGSLVEANKLRFDFTCNHPVPFEDLMEVERIVNKKINDAINLRTDIKTIEDAKASGAIALFGEKYEDTVRVVNIGEYSVELCGGTHVRNTSEVAMFRIISESAAAAGIRRIEAVTGMKAYELANKERLEIESYAKILKIQKSQLNDKINQLLTDNKDLSTELEKIKSESLTKNLSDIVKNAENVDGVNYVILSFENQDNKIVRSVADDICNRDDSYVAVILNDNNGKISFVVKANKSAVNTGVNCGKIVKSLATYSGGNGGGKPDMAQAGAKDKARALEAIKNIKDFL